MKSILDVISDLVKPYIDKNSDNIAPVEDSPVENPYYVGDRLIYKGIMYNVTQDISIGDDLEVGTNISASPKINNLIKTLSNKLKSNGTSSGTDFNFDIKNGVAGWNSAANRDAATFHPFSAGSTADDISYDNTTSGLVATNVQDAIDEINVIKEPIHTILTGTLAANDTSITFTDVAITTTSLIDVYTDTWGLNPLTITTITGQTVLTFEAQSQSHEVALNIH